MSKNTVPTTVHTGKKDAASAAARPRSEAGADGQTRTDDRRFTNTTPAPDNQGHPTISSVLTPNRTDVQVHQTTTKDVCTVPHTVPTIAIPVAFQSPRIDTPPRWAPVSFLKRRAYDALDRYFGNRAGWLWLGYIDGDPSIPEGKPGYSPMQGEWFKFHTARDRWAAAARLAFWHSQGFNVYFVPCLFSKQKRALTTALPSNLLWMDDAIHEDAEVIASSEASRQSIIFTDQDMSATERAALQRAIRDATPGADSCSASPIQPARFPLGFNCKRHGSWPVSVERAAPRVVPLDEIRGRYPVSPTRERTGSTVDQAEWDELPSGAQIASSARFRKLVERNEQLRRILAGERIALPNQNGRMDDSRSTQAAILVCQLVTCPEPWPHDEIRALALHFEATIHDTDDSDNFQRRIDYDLAYYTPPDYKPVPTRGTSPQPARGGRPREITAGELLDTYHERADVGEDGIILRWSRSDAAYLLGTSYNTIARREKELIDQGAIERKISDDRQSSYLVLARGDVYSKRITAPDSAILAENADVYPYPPTAHQEAEKVPDNAVYEDRARELELTLPPDGPEPPDPPALAAPDAVDTLDTWEWADSACSTDVLDALDQAASGEQAGEGGENGPEVFIPSALGLIERLYRRLGRDDDAARIATQTAGHSDQAPVEYPMEPELPHETAQPMEPAASYDPALDRVAIRITPPKPWPRNICPRDLYARRHAWEDALGRMQVLDLPAPPVVSEQAALWVSNN